MKGNTKRVSVNLEGYVIDVAKQKAKLLFNGDMNNYINWLICSNNLKEIRKKIRQQELQLNKEKPKMIENTIKVAMYNNTCEFCNNEIFPGDEICQAEGFKKHIHRNCAKL